MRLQPSNPQTWLALGRYDLGPASRRRRVKELQAAIYLNPESIAPEVSRPDDREAIEIYNDYIQALRLPSARIRRLPPRRRPVPQSEARAHRAREQQPARAGQARPRPHVDRLEAEVLEQPASVPRV